MNRLARRVARLEQRIHATRGGLTDDDRAHMLAWQARTDHKYRGGPVPSEAQLELLARPGFWGRLQEAWGRPGWARLCLEAMERARRPA
jgi:hypothetical protein